jgi:hypothetical protein
MVHVWEKFCLLYPRRNAATRYPERLKVTEQLWPQRTTSVTPTEFYACGHLTDIIDWKIFNLQGEP